MDRRHFLNSSVAAGVAAALPGNQALASLFHALTAVTADVQAVSGAGGEVVLEQAAVQELADSLRVWRVDFVLRPVFCHPFG